MKGNKSFGIYIGGILIFMLLVAAISPVYAIDKKVGYRGRRSSGERSDAAFGLKIGMNFSNVYDIAPEMDWKRGLVFGAFMDYPVNRYFSVQPEVLYSMKGYELGIDFIDMGGNPFYDRVGNRDISYLEIPVMMKFYFFPGRYSRSYFTVGPYFAILLDAEIDDRFSSIDYEFDEYLEDYDFGISLGGGVEFPLDRGYVSTDFRFTFGTVDIPDGGGSMKNETFSITLGLAL